MIRALFAVAIVASAAVARAETALANVGTDHETGVATIKELRAKPATIWGPSGLAPPRAWLEDVVPPQADPHAAARALLADADARFLKFDFAGALDKLTAAERALEDAELGPATREVLRDLNLRRAEVELASKRTARAEGWLRLAVRLGATELDSKRFPPAVRKQHQQAVAAEKAAARIRVRIETTPAASATCVDGVAVDGNEAELVAGEHYLCVASPGYQPKLVRQPIRGDRVKVELTALPRERASRSIRAALIQMKLEAPAARALARSLATSASADRIVLVRGAELFVYDVARDRVEPWQPAELDRPPPPNGNGTPVPIEPGTERPLYKNPWVIGGTIVGVGLATAAILLLTATDRYPIGDFQWE